jgi:hypothetical protein
MSLVEYEELRLWMGLQPGQDEALLGDLLSGLTTLFENQCGRPACPFGKAQPGRVEIVDPIPGSRKLWVDYPIQALTAIAVGRDVAVPDLTLNPALAAQVVWRVGQRIITRTDGGVWRYTRLYPSWVKVTYDAQADLPKDAKLAIQSVAAKLYREKDTGVLKSWTLGDESQTLETAAAQDTTWAGALENHSRGIVL